MKIAVIGAGFTGLSAAYELSKKGIDVTIFEKESSPGGLALGFKEKNWEWTLERYYHHWFTNDKSALNLAKELNYEIIIKRPKTSVFLDNSCYQLDSPISALRFPKLSIFNRLKMSLAIGILKYNPFWKPLEGIRAGDFLEKTMGKTAYEKIWATQLKNKFGDFAGEISLAWFWARIKKRTSSLAYPKGGFLEFAETLALKIKKNGGKIYFNTEVNKIKAEGKKVYVSCSNDLNHDIKSGEFDKMIVTLPSPLFIRITKDLPNSYLKILKKLKMLSVLNLVLVLKKPFLIDGTYWLSICEKESPIMAIVEHTNFMDKKYYNNEHIVYAGNYLPANHPYMKMTKDELLKIYTPYLKKINPNFQLSIINSQLFKDPFAQPIIPTNYSKIIPSFETPLKNVYLANMQQVYPWDRGTNYAIELGERVAKIVAK